MAKGWVGLGWVVFKFGRVQTERGEYSLSQLIM